MRVQKDGALRVLESQLENSSSGPNMVADRKILVWVFDEFMRVDALSHKKEASLQACMARKKDLQAQNRRALLFIQCSVALNMAMVLILLAGL